MHCRNISKWFSIFKLIKVINESHWINMINLWFCLNTSTCLKCICYEYHFGFRDPKWMSSSFYLSQVSIKRLSIFARLRKLLFNSCLEYFVLHLMGIEHKYELLLQFNIVISENEHWESNVRHMGTQISMFILSFRILCEMDRFNMDSGPSIWMNF